jgi:hypothetical protein
MFRITIPLNECGKTFHIQIGRYERVLNLILWLSVDGRWVMDIHILQAERQHSGIG